MQLAGGGLQRSWVPMHLEGRKQVVQELVVQKPSPVQLCSPKSSSLSPFPQPRCLPGLQASFPLQPTATSAEMISPKCSYYCDWKSPLLLMLLMEMFLPFSAPCKVTRDCDFAGCLRESKAVSEEREGSAQSLPLPFLQKTQPRKAFPARLSSDNPGIPPSLLPPPPIPGELAEINGPISPSLFWLGWGMGGKGRGRKKLL